MRPFLDTLETWFRSESSGIVIIVLMSIGTLFYAIAKWSARRPAAARLSRLLEMAAFIAFAAAGMMLTVGSPFNE